MEKGINETASNQACVFISFDKHENHTTAHESSKRSGENEKCALTQLTVLEQVIDLVHEFAEFQVVGHHGNGEIPESNFQFFG